MDIAQTTFFLIDQAKSHPSWILGAFFISGVISGLPIIGALLPIAIFQIGLSSASARLLLNPLHILIALIPGLLLGDLIGFLCGRYSNNTIKSWRVFRKHQQSFEQCERFFKKYGGITIIIGRVSGPLRTLTPFCAGILEMPYLRFLFFDFLASLLWCATHIGAGYLAANPQLWHYIENMWHYIKHLYH